LPEIHINIHPQVHSSVPTAKESQPYDFIIVATKNVPDVPPSLPSIIAPAVTPSHTVIVLAQNGLNIERPIMDAFPQNAVLSVIVLMGAHEKDAGTVVQDDKDIMRIGAFRNSNISPDVEKAAAEEFVEIYRAAGVAKCEINVGEAVQYERWRKLIYNSSFNPICAITGMDTSRLRYAKYAIEELVRPAMEEIRATAKAKGFEIPADAVQGTIDIDPIEVFLKPSMMTDVEKVRYLLLLIRGGR
jgi:2-dehydropantoate 2-reductase